MFVVDVISESRGVNDGERNSNTILLKLWKIHSDKILVDGLVLRFKNWPTLAGFILIPASIWASSGFSMALCLRTSDSHNVFTKVVRPVPEAPLEMESTNIVNSWFNKPFKTYRQPWSWTGRPLLCFVFVQRQAYLEAQIYYRPYEFKGDESRTRVPSGFLGSLSIS